MTTRAKAPVQGTLHQPDLAQAFLFSAPVREALGMRATPAPPTAAPQRDIPAHEDLPRVGEHREYRIHGPPGTGKSWTLATRWIPRAAARFGPENVIVTSLTRTAAREIASRTGELPRQNVGTLHSHIHRAMERPALVVEKVPEWNAAFPHYAIGSMKAAIEDIPEAIADPAQTSSGDALMARAEILRHMLTPRAEWPQDVAAFQETWERWKRETEVLDFTDLIEAAYLNPGLVPGRPSVFIVDEAQDHSALELGVVRRWAAMASYAAFAGDGDQALYSWRGASVRAFLGTEIPKEHNYHLTQSYRVPAPVHAFATEWIGQCGFRYAVDYKPAPHEGEARRLPTLLLARHDDVMKAVEDDVRQGMTVMILTTCSYQLQNLCRALRQAGLLFHNPYRPENGLWNPIRGGVERVRDFLRPLESVYGRQARPWTFRELWRWIEPINARSVLRHGAKVEIQLAAKGDAEDPMTGRPALVDLRWLGNNMTPEGVEGLIAAKHAGADAMVGWLIENSNAPLARSLEYARSLIRRHGSKILLEDPKITVGTVHSVKGGESDSVYAFPDLSPAGVRQWNTMGDPRDDLVRVFYVAMTRARRRLTLCGPSGYCPFDWNATR